MTPDQQAARIVAEFERFAKEMAEPGDNKVLHRNWLLGAKLFAADLIRGLLPNGGHTKYRNQLIEIRNRVLPPVEMESR